MAPELQVPRVTADDLSSFHARTFGSAAPPRSLPYNREYSDCGGRMRIEDHEEYEKDVLGYYPDGVKRTLTDEQIGMFRHSEFYAIVRERQVRKENREAEGEDVEMDEATKEPHELIEEDEGEIYETPNAEREWINPEENEEYWEDPANMQWEMDRDEEVFASLQAITNPDCKADDSFPAPPQGEKRRWVDGKMNNGTKRGRKTRGFVRELDAAVADEQVLDYGEEGSTKPEEVQAPTNQPQPEGKTIWWPVIGE